MPQSNQMSLTGSQVSECNRLVSNPWLFAALPVDSRPPRKALQNPGTHNLSQKVGGVEPTHTENQQKTSNICKFAGNYLIIYIYIIIKYGHFLGRPTHSISIFPSLPITSPHFQSLAVATAAPNHEQDTCSTKFSTEFGRSVTTVLPPELGIVGERIPMKSVKKKSGGTFEGFLFEEKPDSMRYFEIVWDNDFPRDLSKTGIRSLILSLAFWLNQSPQGDSKPWTWELTCHAMLGQTSGNPSSLFGFDCATVPPNPCYPSAFNGSRFAEACRRFHQNLSKQKIQDSNHFPSNCYYTQCGKQHETTKETEMASHSSNWSWGNFQKFPQRPKSPRYVRYLQSNLLRKPKKKNSLQHQKSRISVTRLFLQFPRRSSEHLIEIGMHGSFREKVRRANLAFDLWSDLQFQNLMWQESKRP